MDIASRESTEAVDESEDPEAAPGSAPERKPSDSEPEAGAAGEREPSREEPAGEPDAGARDAAAGDAGGGAELAPEPKGPGPGQELGDEDLRRELLTLLFASPEPLSLARLVELLERPKTERVREALEAAARALEASGLPVVLRELAGGWRLLTDPNLGHVIARLSKAPKAERISSAALETLAIVAYRQPVTKAEVEAIRGVQSGPLLRTLVDRRLVRVTGRADQPGSPLQYGTTRDFLDRFGLASLKDLPRDGELASG